MAWNRNSEDPRTTRLPAKRSMSRLFKLFVSIALSACAVVLYLVFKGESEIIPPPAKPIKQISTPEVHNERVVTPREREITHNFIDPNARPKKLGEKINGYVLLPNGQMHKIIGETHLLSTKPKAAIFDYPADNIIAGILTLRPGETVIGSVNYNGRFTSSFLKSLRSPIIVNADDPDEIKELKRAVNEAKIELKEAYDRGEDIEELIIKAREEFRDLAQYKQDLRKELLRYANRDAVTSDDVTDYMNAVNIMLEEKGIAPINDIPFAAIKLKMKEEWENSNE